MESSQIRLVSLQSMSEAGIEELRLVRNAPEVRRFMKNRHQISREEHRAWYRRVLSSHNMIVFCIVDERTGLLGQVNASLDERHSEGVLGIYVSKGRGTGLGASVQSAFNAYLFDTSPVKVLVANIFPDNLASLKMYQKLGFEGEDDVPDKDGLVSLKLTRGRWQAIGPVSVKYSVFVES